MYTSHIQSFKILASLCSRAGWSKVPEDTFSRGVAQSTQPKKQVKPSLTGLIEPRHDKTNEMASESLLCTQWVAKDPWFLCTDCEDSDQTGRSVYLLVLSCCASV